MISKQKYTHETDSYQPKKGNEKISIGDKNAKMQRQKCTTNFKYCHNKSKTPARLQVSPHLCYLECGAGVRGGREVRMGKNTHTDTQTHTHTQSNQAQMILAGDFCLPYNAQHVESKYETRQNVSHVIALVGGTKLMLGQQKFLKYIFPLVLELLRPTLIGILSSKSTERVHCVFCLATLYLCLLCTATRLSILASHTN